MIYLYFVNVCNYVCACFLLIPVSQFFPFFGLFLVNIGPLGYELNKYLKTCGVSVPVRCRDIIWTNDDITLTS